MAANGVRVEWCGLGALPRQYGEGDTAVYALRDVDLDVEREKLTAVMGRSGSGKSTLMHLLAELGPPHCKLGETAAVVAQAWVSSAPARCARASRGTRHPS